ncbi:hypothetical protein J5N97_014230 [Dioscorea zingiberensis]|uniref:Pectin acetylesterase n=1 Tax=Dioscorea zingiberensis TaxID=325984 RepID=A0A9D5CS21_9LILI|nr:hypothetical protein J5N97_014230 [Dioscorea zingiberensis]
MKMEKMMKMNVLFALVLVSGLALGGCTKDDDTWNVSELANAREDQDVGGLLMVPLTLIQSAAGKGAVCMDGSLPAYHFDPGHGSGANSWLVNLEDSGLYFRGQRIYEAAMEELMSKGMRNADQAFLSGCSAGGLAVVQHCDEFHGLFPANIKVKCIADAGLFLDAVDVAGGRTLRGFYGGVVNLQGAAANLPKNCTSQMDGALCFFPENILNNIQTPLLFVNTAYDVWQIQESLAPKSADPTGYWDSCKKNYTTCDAKQIQFLQGTSSAIHITWLYLDIAFNV